MTGETLDLVPFCSGARVRREDAAALEAFAEAVAVHGASMLGPERLQDAVARGWSRETVAAHETAHCIWYAANGAAVRRVAIWRHPKARVTRAGWIGRATPVRPVVVRAGPGCPLEDCYGFALDNLSGWIAEYVLNRELAFASSHDEIALALCSFAPITKQTGVPSYALFGLAIWQLSRMLRLNREPFDTLRRELARRRKLEAGRLRVLLAPVRPWTYREAWAEAVRELDRSGLVRMGGVA